MKIVFEITRIYFDYKLHDIKLIKHHINCQSYFTDKDLLQILNFGKFFILNILTHMCV